MRYSLIFIFVIAYAAFGFAQDKKIQVKVTFFSSENVFVDGGKTVGLEVGNRLVVKADGKNVAVLEVVFVADYSASCKILKKVGDFQTGSMAETFVKVAGQEPEKQGSSVPEPAVERPAPKKERKSRVRKKKTRISGSISAQYFGLQDNTEAGLDFGQPGVRLNIRGRQLWGRHFNFRVRTRARYNNRSRDYNTDVAQNEWRNRLYELSFGYENREQFLNFKAGRLISRHISSVGYVDGLQLQMNLTPGFQIGAFGGTQPDIRNSGFSSTVTKYGVFANVVRGKSPRSRLESTVSLAGEYNAGTVSREFLALRNSLNYGALRIYQSLEGDLNREWRKEKSGQAFSLTNLYASATYNLGKRATVGLTFDNRKNYWTYEVRSVADSLFDDALRTGLRANASLKLPWQIRMYGNGGLRKRDGEAQGTYSWFGGLSKNNLLMKRLSLHLRGSGFNNQATRGLNTSAQLSKSFRSGHRFDVAYGLYRYHFDLQALIRNNHWVRSGFYLNGFQRLFLSGEYQYDWGGDIRGFRFFGEIGYRL